MRLLVRLQPGLPMKKEDEIKDHLHNAVWVIEQFVIQWHKQEPFDEEKVRIMHDKYDRARTYLDKLVEEDFGT